MLDRQYTAMVVSATDKTAKSLSAILLSSKFSRIISVNKAGDARRKAEESQVDIAVINTPLPDDFGIQLAEDLSEKNLGVLVIVGRDIFEQVAGRVEPYGVVVLAKPVVRAELVQAIRILRVMREKLLRLEARATSLESKMKEIRLVNRAKWLLIDRLKMSEEEAHRYIEKAAMDDCVSKGVVAEGIIKTYE
jgi:AmiR/NasT family two-component response regulator